MFHACIRHLGRNSILQKDEDGFCVALVTQMKTISSALNVSISQSSLSFCLVLPEGLEMCESGVLSKFIMFLKHL